MKAFIKITWCLFMWCFPFTGVSAQNLVPNPSFEDTIVCPFGANEVNAAVGWYASRNSPDYFNICNTNSAGVPSNFVGYQFAQNGNAYMGLIAFSRNGVDVREHFACQLLTPLTIGTKYFLSFYLSHANAFNNLSCNKIVSTPIFEQLKNRVFHNKVI